MNQQQNAWSRTRDKYLHVAVESGEHDDDLFVSLILVDPTVGTVASMTIDDTGVDNLRSILARAQRQMERLDAARTARGGEG